MTNCRQVKPRTVQPLAVLILLLMIHFSPYLYGQTDTAQENPESKVPAASDVPVDEGTAVPPETGREEAAVGQPNADNLTATPASSPPASSPTLNPTNPTELRALFLPDNLRQFADTESFIPLPRNGAVPTPDFISESSRLLRLDAGKSVLVIGTATGYTAASLAQKADRVYVVELAAGLLESYRKTWEDLGLVNIETINYSELPGENAGYDAVFVHGVTERVPPRITGSLRPGGVLLAPLIDGRGTQGMILMELGDGGWTVSAAGLSFFPAQPIQFGD